MEHHTNNSHLGLEDQITLLTAENTKLRNEMNAMQSRYEEAYIQYKIFEHLFIFQLTQGDRDKMLFLYTFLKLKNKSTKELRENGSVKDIMLNVAIEHGLYSKDELTDKIYKDELFNNKMDQLFRTYYNHWRPKIKEIRKKYFDLYLQHSQDIPIFNPLEPLP